MPQEQFDRFAADEQFILVVTEKGFGKRSSAYEYRITGRGGKGIRNYDMTERNGAAVAAFPIGANDQIMLVTDAGQLIRCPVDDIRIAGRLTQGVTLFRVGEEERVVSIARLREDGDEDAEPGDGDQGT
jgi:DNA gyrase subunit A